MTTWALKWLQLAKVGSVGYNWLQLATVGYSSLQLATVVSVYVNFASQGPLWADSLLGYRKCLSCYSWPQLGLKWPQVSVSCLSLKLPHFAHPLPSSTIRLTIRF